jgi:tRNA 2-thiouridine synthesizing protein B
MEIEKTILYLYGFSPTSSKRLNEFMTILKEQLNSDFDIYIVMIHDAVIGTTKNGKTPAFLEELVKFSIKIYALIPDIIARGMDPKNLLDQILGIEYDDLVDLLVDTNKIVSWM